MAWKDVGAKKILAKLATQRARKRIDPPTLRGIQRAGDTFRRGLVETRGRKKVLTKAHLKKPEANSRAIAKKTKGEREVPWEEIARKARVPKVDPTTIAKIMRDGGFPLKARRFCRNRFKIVRGPRLLGTLQKR